MSPTSPRARKSAAAVERTRQAKAVKPSPAVKRLAAVDASPARVRASFAQLFAWWRDGRLKPLVSARYTLDQVVPALTELSERRATGKVVLEVS